MNNLNFCIIGGRLAVLSFWLKLPFSQSRQHQSIYLSLYQVNQIRNENSFVCTPVLPLNSHRQSTISQFHPTYLTHTHSFIVCEQFLFSGMCGTFPKISLSYSLDFGLDPSEKGLIACHTIALGAFLVRTGSSNRHIALFLLVCNQWGLHESIAGLTGATWGHVETLGGGKSRGLGLQWVWGGVFGLLEVVCLALFRLECAFIESKMVMFFTSVSFLLLWDPSPNIIGVANIVECLIVGPLEVVVHLTTLFLLS